jgi:Zn ribbon nucleic-acid-binding protein
MLRCKTVTTDTPTDTGTNYQEAEHMTQTLARTKFTAHDRCDRCSAQAYVRVVLPSGDLLFCGHHWSRHEEVLRPKAVEVYDETHLLSPTPTAE